MNFYENVRAACSRKGTTLTEVLKAIGRSTGATGAWKSGMLPKLDVAIQLADYLEISLDELVYGPEGIEKWFPEAPQSELTGEQQEWLEILSHIPDDRKQMCKDFLRTHMVVPEKYASGKMA